jgi:hypothetical protein
MVASFIVYAWPHASLKEFVMVQMSWLLGTSLLGSKFVWAQESKSQPFDPSREELIFL